MGCELVTEQGGARPDHLRLITGPDGEPGGIDGLDGTERPRRGPRSDEPIGVLIAEGQALIRAGYRALLDSEEQIEVIGEAACGRQAITTAAEIVPHVVLLDFGLPGLDPLETIATIVAEATGVAVLLIVPRETDETVFRALEAGAAGVLQKDADSEELIRAVQVLAQGDALLSAAAMRRLIGKRPANQLHSRPHPDQLEELTDREREVMALAATGLSNNEIAEQLVISPKTAKTHVSRAMVKLGARHRAQLVVLAYETGLVLASDNGQESPVAVISGSRHGGCDDAHPRPTRPDSRSPHLRWPGGR
jgi:DNA-binding NarL/FixJ family response regulator